jgi:hypothetical protein
VYGLLPVSHVCIEVRVRVWAPECSLLYIFVPRNFLAVEIRGKLFSMKCRAVEDIPFIFETCFGFFEYPANCM